MMFSLMLLTAGVVAGVPNPNANSVLWAAGITGASTVLVALIGLWASRRAPRHERPKRHEGEGTNTDLRLQLGNMIDEIVDLRVQLTVARAEADRLRRVCYLARIDPESRE